MTSTTGEPLVAAARKGTLRLGLEGVPSSPYVYDLVDPHAGRVPSVLSYKPQPKDLAVVEMRFHGDTAVRGGEFRLDYRPYRQYAAGETLVQDMPAIRTDYVSAQPGTTWGESAIGGTEMEQVAIASRHGYKPGSKQTVDWFAPITRPRDNPPFWSSYRDPFGWQFNVQPWSDGTTGHAGYLAWGDQLTFSVFQDGVEIAHSDGWASARVEGNPDGDTTLTADLVATRSYRLSPKTHTVWQIVSPHVGGEDSELIPLLQMDYAVTTDMSGNARGGLQTVSLTPSFLSGVVGAGSIAGATLAVSFDDGRSWRTVAVVRVGSSWRAVFTAPQSGFVSLKATAWDTRGNRITQEITRAYGLA
jgi:hypothetical protein